MALLTFANLKTGIQEYVQNSEQSFVDNLPNFIRAAEDRVYANVQIPSFFKSDDSQSTTGSSEFESPAISDYSVDGMIEVFDVRLRESHTPGGIAEKSSSTWRTLLRKDWDFLREAYPDIDITGRGIPKYYAVAGAAIDDTDKNPKLTIRIAPTPNANYLMSIDYYGKLVVDMLEESTSGTWLSATWPNVLLYGCLIEAYTFMKGEPDLVQFYEMRFKEGLEKIGMTSTGEQRNRLKPPMRV